MTTPDRTPYVLDATIAVKWSIQSPDELHHDIAEIVLAHFEEGRIRLLAPQHIRSEVGHALLRAVRWNRITFDQGREAIERFYSYGIELVPHSGILLGGYELARRYRCSFYDATYLALAVMTDSHFIHADGNLRNALGGRFSREPWLEDYPS